ncbi:MAG: CRTAC1 family protein [Armatimonadota bacterium]
MSRLRTGWLLAWALAALALAGCEWTRAAAPSADPGSAPELSVPFEEVSAAAGVELVQGHPDRLLDIREVTGSGAGFLDFDADGDLDLVLLATDRCALYRNEGSGRFQDVSATAGLPQKGQWTACAAGDYDADGFPDLFLNGFDCVALLHNEGGKRFRDVTAAAGLTIPSLPEPHFGVSAGWADYDRDGQLDLYVGRYVRFGPKSPRFCPSRTGGLVTCGPAYYQPQIGALYRNVGGGRFEEVTESTGAHRVDGKTWGVRWLDFDDDGWDDLYLANDEVAGNLLRNVAGKRFEDVAVAAGAAYDRDGRVHGGMGVDSGDFDGDGRLDLIVTTFVRESYSLYRNLDGRTFTDVAPVTDLAQPTHAPSGWGTKLFDYDNDGRLDVMFVNGHATDTDTNPQVRADLEQSMQLFRNEGKRFQSVPLGALAKPIVGRGAAFGDYDNDGFCDVAVIDMEGRALLLRNRGASAPGGAHWIGFRLEGGNGNRDALGARVTLQAGGRSQVAEVRTCGSVFSTHDPRVRFGLGPSAEVQEVSVRWPDGKLERFTGLAADRYHTLTQGRGAAAKP